jgi:predicted metal-dependent peptidase
MMNDMTTTTAPTDSGLSFSDRFAARRALAQNACPYYGVALYRLMPVPTRGIGTLAVDAGWRLYVDPDCFDTWSVTEFAAGLIHEVNHVLRDHAARETRHSAKNHKVWNIGTDAAINDDLREICDSHNRPVVALPECAVFPSSFGLPDGNLEEWYYDRILEQTPADHPESGEGDGGGGAGQPVDGNGNSPDCHAPEHGCGSGAGGGRRDYELGDDDATNPVVDEGSAELVRRQVAADTIEHHKTRGTLPGGLIEWATGVLAPPKVSWRKQLAAAAKRAIANKTGVHDFTYRKPGRRRIPGIVTPSMVKPIPHVAVVVDTSGSMSDNDVHAALSEIKGIMTQVGVRGEQLQVLMVDAAVQGVQKVQKVENLKVNGRGGTDMRVGIEAAEQLRPRPDVIVVLTDGATPWPDKQGRAKLVIGVIGTADYVADAAERWQTPPWAAVVEIPTGCAAP